MKVRSSNNKNEVVSLPDAMVRGVPEGGGLYFPEEFPQIDWKKLEQLKDPSLKAVALELLPALFEDSLSSEMLQEVIEEAFCFDFPVVRLKNTQKPLFVLELFHGPSGAFKDAGAQFMAALLPRLIKEEHKTLHIITATSGDTGGAVAAAFHRKANTRVTILYPLGMVSPLQEAQLVGLGENIQAFAIEGSFDDCQALAKRALVDEELKQKEYISSANSINLARLLPQTLYYLSAFLKLKRELALSRIAVVVPSGNLGNLVAGLYAQRMGLSAAKFVTATNANDAVVRYLLKGVFEPSPTKSTIANAMDVGNPNNFPRLSAFFGDEYEEVKKLVVGYSLTDEEIKEGISKAFTQHQYVFDPHGACGYSAAERVLQDPTLDGAMILHTAHPAKFLEVVSPLLPPESISLPFQLKTFLNMKFDRTVLPNSYEVLREKICTAR